MSQTSRALSPFGTTIFATMSHLALEHDAVNLAQGFPDFDGPAFIKQAAKDAIDHQPNQYAPMPGLPALRKAIAARFAADTGVACDPDAQVVVTSGCTEAVAAAMLGLCEPGDEVVLFEPFYDSYRACVAMAGAVPRYVPLRPRYESGPNGQRRIASFDFDPAELAAAFVPLRAGARTRAVLVNTPHNPTGKVFSRAELAQIAALCVRHNALALSDEVYERLLFEPGTHPHIPLATVPGMAERTLTLSSLGKTFSLTGWKVGWAVGPEVLVAAVRAAHQFLTFSVPTPLQHAAAVALTREGEAVPALLATLREGRDALAGALEALGFVVHVPAGTYFICADHTAVSARLGVSGDQAFVLELIKRCRVAAIPPSVFYNDTSLGTSLVRFAFCKRAETIAEGIKRLQALGDRR